MSDTYSTSGFSDPDFAYGENAGGGDLAATLSIYADRAHVRASLQEDARAAGLRVVGSGVPGDLAEGSARLGDIVVVDCPQADAEVLAGLMRLDMRAARGGVRLIVSTTVDALDDVFGCMDQSSPLLLVDPDRAERVIALGEVLASFPSARLRELSEDDRLMLLRLTEQVGQIAGRLDPQGGSRQPGLRLNPGPAPSPAAADSGAAVETPDPRVMRRIIRQRQLRARFFDGDLFADPSWDMLLDLAAARIEGKRVSVTSLCIASGVPPTTALRRIGQMVDMGLFVRACDDHDRRRAFIELSDTAADAMARYFSEIVSTAPLPV